MPIAHRPDGLFALCADGLSLLGCATGAAGSPALVCADFVLAAGECVALGAENPRAVGALLRVLAGDVRADLGHVIVRHAGEDVDVAAATPWERGEIRRVTVGVIGGVFPTLPPVPAVDAVAEPALRAGRTAAVARETAERLLGLLGVAQRRWPLPPAGLSVSERQRVAVARGLAVDYPVLLLDDPTAALDPAARDIVVRLLVQAKRRGSALVGSFPDDTVRRALADRTVALRGWGRDAA